MIIPGIPKNATKKAVPKSAATRDRLMDAAEALYAQHGLQGVSLRQISTAAGAGSSNAVQYHFGGVEGLIRAVLERHSHQLEIERATLLARYAGQGALTCRELLEVIYRPILGPGDVMGAPLFARFSLALLAAPQGWKPLVDVLTESPVTAQVLEMTVETNPHVPRAVTLHRLLYSGIALLTYVVNATMMVTTPTGYAAAVTDAFTLATASLTASAADDCEVLAAELEHHFNAAN